MDLLAKGDIPTSIKPTVAAMSKVPIAATVIT